jgi:hypothetical protein
MAWEGYSIHLAPGEAGEFAWEFDPHGAPSGLQWIMFEPRGSLNGARVDTVNHGYSIIVAFGGGKKVTYWVTAANRSPDLAVDCVLTGGRVDP